VALPVPSSPNNPQTTPKRRPPALLSAPGMFVLLLAVCIELTNFLLALLDLALGLGTALAVPLNAFASFFFGWWVLRYRGEVPKRKVLAKKILVPLIGNILPLIRAFPFFWVYTVWSTLDKSGDAPPQEEQSKVPEEQQNTASSQAAKTPA